MKRAIISFLLLTVVLAAQETVRKFVPLKYVRAVQAAQVLGVFGQEMRISEAPNGIALSGPPEVVKAMEEMLAKIDVPPAVPKNVELTAYLLIGSVQGQSGSLPDVLQPVIKQLQSLFTYKSFRLVDTMIARMRAGGRRASVFGAVDVPGETLKGNAHLAADVAEVVPDPQGHQVRITNLALTVSMPNGLLKDGQINWVRTGIETSVDVREGQKVVVGKANMAGAPDQALILVLTAKVLD